MNLSKRGVDMKKKPVGRPANKWEVRKRAVPVPALGEFEVWLAKWKAENSK